MPRIQVISESDAEGELADIYAHLGATRGKIAEVHKIQSLRPASITKHMDLYMEIMFSKSPLKRATREMIAVVVSKSNACTYCQTHHGSALNHYWKDAERIEKLKKDYTQAGLNEQELALAEFAQVLTLNPGDHEKTDHTAKLKEVGLEDKAILDATLVIAYFNFVNRIVLGLGVELEGHQGEGFKY